MVTLIESITGLIIHGRYSGAGRSPTLPLAPAELLCLPRLRKELLSLGVRLRSKVIFRKLCGGCIYFLE